MDHGGVHLVVTGPPASGKSTLARLLAEELGLRLLAKDEIKQRLLDERPATDPEQSRERGREAVRLLLERAVRLQDAVLDSVWVDRDRARRDLAALGDVVEVFCRCEPSVMRDRYARGPRARDRVTSTSSDPTRSCGPPRRCVRWLVGGPWSM